MSYYTLSQANHSPLIASYISYFNLTFIIFFSHHFPIVSLPLSILSPSSHLRVVSFLYLIFLSFLYLIFLSSPISYSIPKPVPSPPSVLPYPHDSHQLRHHHIIWRNQWSCYPQKSYQEFENVTFFSVGFSKSFSLSHTITLLFLSMHLIIIASWISQFQDDISLYVIIHADLIRSVL